MKKLELIILPALLLIGAWSPLAASDEEVPPTLNKGNSQITEIGAEGYLERNLASDELWEKGAQSLNILTALSLSDDPEQSWRARNILRWLDLELTPDTPSEIFEAVESYLTAKTDQQRAALYLFLFEKEAYLQLFRLPRYLKDKEAADVLSERVAKLAVQVAEERILAGRDQEALAILADARDSKSIPSAGFRWAALASAMGMREELWDGLSSEEKMRFARWEGDLDLIQSLAGPNHEVQTTLRMLTGDSQTYLSKSGLRQDDFGLRARMLAALARGNEEESDSEKLAQVLSTQLRKKGGEESPEALSLLTQLGYFSEALPFHEERDPVRLFDFYEKQEMLVSAFRTLDLELGKPVPQEWIDECISQIADDFELENEGCNRLFTLGLFFVNRGEIIEGERLLDALYEKCSALGVEELVSYLAFLSGRDKEPNQTRYPEYAIPKARASNQKQLQPLTFLRRVLPGEELLSYLYHFLLAKQEEKDEWEIVRRVLAFFGRQTTVEAEVLAAIIKDLEERARDDRSSEPWELLIRFATLRGDMDLMERALRAILELKPMNIEVEEELALLLFYYERAEEASQAFAKLLEQEPSRRDWLGYYAVSLQKSGKEEKASEILNMLEKLALGNGRFILSLGILWGELGNYEKQYQYYHRALLLTPADSNSWVGQLTSFAESARYTDRWAQAAACCEVYGVYRNFGLTESLVIDQSMRARIDWPRAMAAYTAGDKEQGDYFLQRLVNYAGVSSFIADDVLPVLRQKGLHKQADEIWKQVSPIYRHSLKTFPNGHNSYNTAAWVASRAARDLDDASRWIEVALAAEPLNSAYLDTKAEVIFAKGDRQKALELSEYACSKATGIPALKLMRRQYKHFRDDPFPLSNKEEEFDSEIE